MPENTHQATELGESNQVASEETMNRDLAQIIYH